MAYTHQLQDWITLKTAATVQVVQAAEHWFETESVRDMNMIVSTKNVSGAGSPSLVLYTSPSLNEELFRPAASTILVSNSITTLRTTFDTASVPIARYVRWQLSAGAGMEATFCIHLSYTLGFGGCAPELRHPRHVSTGPAPAETTVKTIRRATEAPCSPLQPWTTISGAAGASIIQSEPEWLDLADYQDIYAICSSKLMSANTDIKLESAPVPEDDLFLEIASFRMTSNTTLKNVIRFATATTPLSRYLRWRATNVGTFEGTFRLDIRPLTRGALLRA